MTRKLWGGRFKKATDPAVERFTSSIQVDHRLALHDVQGSIAHAKMLGKCEIIPQKDADRIVNGLTKIQALIQAGKFAIDPSAEDIHSQVQAALSKLIGQPAERLHTARSRNDQIALDLRLYCRDVTKQLLKAIRQLQATLVEQASAHRDVIMPGYTHLQQAQPILFAHHLLAYVEMLDRDAGRLQDGLKRINLLPLGACALAGTSLPIDRAYVARLLKFDGVCENSLDAVSDRDFAVELVAALALLGAHLSRFAEDVIFWCTQEVALVELDDAFATGSSLMPQKKNPDVLELIRGQSGAIIGHLVSLLTLLKGLPLAYNRDLQWDKPAVFQAVDGSLDALRVLERLVRHLRVRAERGEQLVASGALCATDLAEFLVQRGVAFSEAHEIVGRVVQAAERKGKSLTELRLSDLRPFSSLFDDEALDRLKPRRSVELKLSRGGTSPQQVKQAIDRWRLRLKG